MPAKKGSQTTKTSSSPKPATTPKPAPGPKPTPPPTTAKSTTSTKTSGPDQAKAQAEKISKLKASVNAPGITLQQKSDRSRTLSRALFQATPAKQERNKATQTVIAANKRVDQLRAAANAPGLTMQQRSDRSRTLGRALNQQSKAKAALNKITGYKKPTTTTTKTTKPTTKKTTTKPTTKTTKKKTTKNGKTTNPTNTNPTVTDPEVTNPTDPTDPTDVTSVNPTPNTPTPGVSSEAEDAKTYKPATPDLIQLQEEEFPIEVITDLLFEDIGGTEILNIARHDLVSGIDIRYQQISNLAKIENIYGGANLIALQNTSEQVFSKYPLRRYQFIPTVTDDPSGLNSHVYLDASGNLIIELINIDNSYQIEVEFQAADINDIIY